MLLMDGVRYEEWTPPDEAVLAGMVKEHARDIFGEHTLYFGNLKKRIKTQAGVGSIPDGWAIILGVPMQAYPVEIEHSSHDVYGHISPQIDKMQAALKNPDAQRQIISAIYEEITQDGLVNAKAKAKVGSHDLHKLLSDSISNPQLQLVIVIDTASAQLQECAANKAVQPKIVGFHTFQRVGAEVVHIHQFEPLAQTPPRYPPNDAEQPKQKPEQPGNWAILWQEFLNKTREKGVPWGPHQKVNSSVYQTIGIGRGGVHFEWYSWGGGLGVELHFEKASLAESKKLLDFFRGRQKELESTIGQPLTFQCPWSKNWARFYVHRQYPTGKKPPDVGDELKQWAVDSMVKLYNACKPLLDSFLSGKET